MHDSTSEQPVTLERRGAIGLLRINNPPVNALSKQTVAALARQVDAFEADGSLRALLVYGAGRTFVAGGDITNFEAPDFDAGPYNRILGRLEASPRLVVAALHGTPLGGGLELALACHYRVALPDTRVGLPEVKLGLLPGSLGSQRLPRAVGAAPALEMMLSGRMVDAQEALETGIIDAIADEEQQGEQGALRAGLHYLERLLACGALPQRLSERSAATSGLPPDFFEQARRKEAAAAARYPARAAILTAVEAAATLPFAQGEVIEADLLRACVKSPESRAMRHLFFAERQAAKIPGLPGGLPLKPVERVAVIGAGTIGSSIAMLLANAGLPVVLVERDADALEHGLACVHENYKGGLARGEIRLDQYNARMERIQGTVALSDVAGCDLVVDAVIEGMPIKSQLWQQLGALCKPGAILATATSTLDVNSLADVSRRPADTVGLHFVSPLNVMRLLEVVRGHATAPAVLATMMQLARRIGIVPVAAGLGHGFIGNRMAEVYAREAEFLLMEGATPARIDAVMEKEGMAMGPCRMLDLAGVDVDARRVIQYGKAGGLPPDASYRAVVRKLYELGRHGQKAGAGFYRYTGCEAQPDYHVTEICAELARKHGIARRNELSDTEIVERLFYPMVNEAAQIMDEGIAYRAGDIDMVWTAGYGFPDYRGGPVWLADEHGIARIAGRLAHYAGERGNAYGYWNVSPLLARLAHEGKRLSDWSAP